MNSFSASTRSVASGSFARTTISTAPTPAHVPAGTGSSIVPAAPATVVVVVVSVVVVAAVVVVASDVDVGATVVTVEPGPAAVVSSELPSARGDNQDGGHCHHEHPGHLHHFLLPCLRTIDDTSRQLKAKGPRDSVQSPANG